MPTVLDYANLHRHFLANNHPEMLKQLGREGRLNEYLESVGQCASDMHEDMSARMMTAKTLPTEYKERIRALEAIPLIVEECVLHELIYQPKF